MQIPDELKKYSDPSQWPMFSVRPVPIPTVLVPQNNDQCKTVIVTGHYRGGTSAIAAMVNSLGVYMGHDNKARYECLFENPDLIDTPQAEMESIVDDMNSHYELWGWKNPLPSVFNELPDNVRNPHYILVTRDPAAILQMDREVTEMQKTVDAAIENYTQCCEHYQWLFQQLKERNAPLLLVTMERMQQHPGLVFLGIASFLGITPTPAQMADCFTKVSTGGYNLPPSQWWSDVAATLNPPIADDHPVIIAIKSFLQQSQSGLEEIK
jgi:hypothetical protein